MSMRTNKTSFQHPSAVPLLNDPVAIVVLAVALLFKREGELRFFALEEQGSGLPSESNTDRRP